MSMSMSMYMYICVWVHVDVSTCLELITSVHCAWHLQVVKIIKNLDIRAAEEVFCVSHKSFWSWQIS